MIEDIGIWITPLGERIDVYGSPHLTHEGWAMAHGQTIDSLVRLGYIRVSSGTTFQFSMLTESVLSDIRAVIRGGEYEGRRVTLIDMRGQEWEVAVEDVLEDGFALSGA